MVGKMTIKNILEDLNQREKIQKMVSEMTTDPALAAYASDTVDYLLNEVNQHLLSCAEIDDQEDLDYYTAVQYVELKARWIQMNLRLSYQAVRTGQGNPKMLMKASGTTALLVALEPFVSKSYVSQIQTLLAQPVFGEGLKNAA